MLRGLATVSFFATDMAAAKAWYSELLGTEPYFERRLFEGRHVAPGDAGFDQAPPGYLEFRFGDYEHELGIVSSRFAPHDTATSPAGAVVFWHVDDVAAALERLTAMGAKPHEPLVHREAGFVTASVVDPFGNILGVMYNPHYLEILGDNQA